jgi:hypothetical protein
MTQTYTHIYRRWVEPGGQKEGTTYGVGNDEFCCYKKVGQLERSTCGVGGDETKK